VALWFEWTPVIGSVWTYLFATFWLEAVINHRDMAVKYFNLLEFHHWEKPNAS
jgi:hypothetical protein